MSGWLIVMLYVAGCLVTLVFVARRTVEQSAFEPEVEDRVLSAALGLCVCWFWPVLLLGYLGRHLIYPDMRVRSRADDLDRRAATARAGAAEAHRAGNTELARLQADLANDYNAEASALRESVNR
ncbi:hypothetical protein GCM10027047_01330 [Rhodococcus aerolatus]